MTTDRLGLTGVLLAAALTLTLATTGCGDDSMAGAEGAIAPAAEALGIDDGGRGPMGLVGRLECRLGLTEAQAADIRIILKDEFGDAREARRAEMKARRAAGGAPPTNEERKARAAERAVQRVERMEQVAERVRGVLTTDQAREFDALVAEMRAVAADGGGPAAHFARKLDLTEGQKAQIEALFEARRAEHQSKRAERRALREEARSLGREAGDLRQKARGARREFREERGEFHRQLRSILTPEQQAKLDAERQKWQDCRGN
jgi:Spy/CpxP family protein refolding chaperone